MKEKSFSKEQNIPSLRKANYEVWRLCKQKTFPLGRAILESMVKLGK